VESLTRRQERILDFVVREYVELANPVGSKTVVESCDLGVSSATIRAEMAHLEKLGYLTQPHTSAGRLPTPRGYRYFVEYLMREMALPLSERRMIEHQFHQVDRDLEQWIKLAGAILTSKSDTASLVTAPRARRSRFKRLELARHGDSSVLLLLVLNDGTIRRRIVDLHGASDTEALPGLARELDTLLFDLTGEQVRASCSGLTAAQAAVAREVAELMDDVDLHHDLELHRYGFANILRQPEFTETEKMEKVVAILEEPGHLETILSEIALSHSGVQVIIGGEERWPRMSEFSLVLARYGVAWRTTGVVGLMGPIRMPYSRNVPMVSYVAELMSRLVRERYA
jgi:heat-inducible transcriptional repressor